MTPSEDRTRMHFKNRLNALSNNLTQWELADKIGISRKSVGFYLRGERMPDSTQLPKIAAACNVSTDYLLGLTDVKTPNIDMRHFQEYTSLAETSINMLHDMYTPRENKYAGGATDADACTPPAFVNWLIQNPNTLVAAIEFCAAVNDFVKHDTAMLGTAPPELPTGEYAAVHRKELARLRMLDAKESLSSALDELWDNICAANSTDPRAVWDWPDNEQEA